jgi:hypothetical protein
MSAGHESCRHVAIAREPQPLQAAWAGSGFAQHQGGSQAEHVSPPGWLLGHRAQALQVAVAKGPPPWEPHTLQHACLSWKTYETRGGTQAAPGRGPRAGAGVACTSCRLGGSAHPVPVRGMYAGRWWVLRRGVAALGRCLGVQLPQQYRRQHRDNMPIFRATSSADPPASAPPAPSPGPSSPEGPPWACSCPGSVRRCPTRGFHIVSGPSCYTYATVIPRRMHRIPSELRS